MFIPYLTVGTILTGFMLFMFGGDRAGAFLVTYTIGYAAVMIFKENSEKTNNT